MSAVKKAKLRITCNSPIILLFSCMCVLAVVLDKITGGATTARFFMIYRASLSDPSAWFRIIGHMFGHAGWEHLFGNLGMILLLGPVLEEKYGSGGMCLIICMTGLVNSIWVMFVVPSAAGLGASGLVFAFILLASFSNASAENGIPITFILIATIYLGQEAYNGLFVDDNISQTAHILGGLTGAGMGWLMGKHVRKEGVMYERL